MSASRKSRLSGAMQKKVAESAVAATDDDVSEATTAPQGADQPVQPSLHLAPPLPAENEPQTSSADAAAPGTDAEAATRGTATSEPPQGSTVEPEAESVDELDGSEESATVTAEEGVPSKDADVTADANANANDAITTPVEAPVESGSQTAPEPPARTPRKSTGSTGSRRGQKAQVTAGVGQIDINSNPLTHLRNIMETGRDQRRYVEDLPRRNDKGTYLRLPRHLQDALSEYCDRDSAPMADFIAAVLDAYFRDLGLLPPLGEGHRPDEEFLARIRKESRTYDY